jgi:hypothetical protein
MLVVEFGTLVTSYVRRLSATARNNITCQRSSARQCCKGHVSFLWEKPIFDPSQKPNPLTYNHKNLHNWLRWWPKPMCKLPLQSVGYGRPHAYVKYNDFATFFPFIYIFLYFFSQWRSGRTKRSTNMHEGSNDAVWHKDVPFRGLVDVRMR